MIVLPHAPPPTAGLTEEQRRRIARSRLLARQRRQASVEEEMHAQRDALRLVRERLVATSGRIILNCPFAQKDRAKELGARWDIELRKWYIPQGAPIEEFAAWLSAQNRLELTKAQQDEKALLSSSRALAQNWAHVCNACSLRVDKEWDECAACELARTYVASLQSQVARRLRTWLPTLSDIAQEEVAAVVVHVLVRLPPTAFGASPRSSSSCLPRAVLKQIEVLWRGTVTELSLGSRQIKELGGRCCATLQAGELESGLEDSATRVCQVLSGVLHDEAGWMGIYELLSRMHLEPSERTTCKERKARVLLRVAERYLDEDDAHTASCLGQEAIAEFSNDLLKATHMALQARIYEKQRCFDTASWHYYNLSKLHLDKEMGHSCSNAALCTDADPPHEERGLAALTKAASCAILALEGPEKRSSIFCVLLEDERTSSTALHGLMCKIQAQEEVPEADISAFEELVRLHSKEAPYALREFVREHNRIALGRRRGRVKDWNSARGFGFISRKGAGDLFCHVSDITDGDMLLEGEMVEYKEQPGVRGPKAVTVTGGHWEDGLPTTRKRRQTHAPAKSPHQHGAPPGMEGKGFWVLAGDFAEHKSFGCFSCPGCGNAWPSAHAFPEYKQGCKMCEMESRPCCLWYNDSEFPREGPAGQASAEHHDAHDQSRCEACRQLGDCRKTSKRLRC